MGNTIKGNVGELFVLSTGEIKEPKNLDKFHPQSNVNILVINIEGIPQEKTMAQINFAPTNKSGWASVWFPLNRKGVLHHKLENEDEYRTFTQYTIQVPEPITTLNLNNSSALNVGITFRHIGGIDFLGAYETIQDLIAEYPPYQDLNETLAIAYVYGTTNYGFYQVVFDNGVYVWQKTPSPIAQLQIKPYNMGNIQIQGGYGTRTPIQSIADSQYNLIWLELNTIASRLDHFYDKEHIDTAFLEKYTTPTGDNDVFSIYGITAQGQQAIYQASVENHDNTIVVRDGVGRIKDLDEHNISSEAHSNEFNKKVDKITQEQRDSLGFMENDDRIVPGVDGNLNEMPIKATARKEKNTIVMRDINGNFQDLYDHNTSPTAHSNEFNKKVDKTQTIIGIDLQDDILLGEFKQALGEATRDLSGLMSADDKKKLDTLRDLLGPEGGDSDAVVNTIREVLDIFQNYPEGVKVIEVLNGKVDKIIGKGLSTNDFTDEYKNKVDTLDTKVDDIEDNVGEISSIVDYTQSVMQNRLVAGNNITIDNYNEYSVISASGVDLNEMSYFDYAGRIYGDKYSLLKNAWEHSLTVNVIDKDHYPNGETEGIIIPQGVTSIGESAFYGWTSNNHPLVIPNSVTSIGWGAFSGWSSNNQPLVIPNSVTSIGDSAFYGWSSNTHPLVIPESVTSIGDGAFYYWSLVPYVEIQAITPPTLASRYVFGGQNDAPIYVPDESVDDYKTATNWVDLADRIFPVSDKEGISASDIIDDLTSTDTNKPLSANQGKVLNDTTAKLAESNVFTQPQQVPNATLPQHTTNKLQVETMFEMFKRELRGYNLAMPDLEDKEYLGDGVYRLSELNGITVDYNIYNGEYNINGTTNSTTGLKLGAWLPNGNYYRTFYYISGTKKGYAVWAFGESEPFDLYMGTTNLYNSQIITDTTPINRKNTVYLYSAGGVTYDNYQFKLQLEKGDTATPYTVPGKIPAYKIVGEE